MMAKSNNIIWQSTSWKRCFESKNVILWHFSFLFHITERKTSQNYLIIFKKCVIMSVQIKKLRRTVRPMFQESRNLYSFLWLAITVGISSVFPARCGLVRESIGRIFSSYQYRRSVWLTVRQVGGEGRFSGAASRRRGNRAAATCPYIGWADMRRAGLRVRAAVQEGCPWRSARARVMHAAR